MLAATPSRSPLPFLLSRKRGRSLLRNLERLVLPGIILHYLARKWWMEKVVTSALGKGCRQIVVLGAGFDTLAWRMHLLWPEAHFFELDHPNTQKCKTEALGSLSPGKNLHFAALDLATELPSDYLKKLPGFDSERYTCFVAEGVFMYFPAKRVVEILGDLDRVATSSTITFSFMEKGPDGRAAFRGRQSWIDSWLRFRREPFAWALDPAKLEFFLQPIGRWQVRAVAGAAELHRDVLTPAGLGEASLAEGEWLCCAS